MTTTFVVKTPAWAMLLAALGAGVAIGQAVGLPGAMASPPATLSPVDRLLIQDEIRQKLVLYSLYADGDGPGGRPRNLRALADTLMTPDVVNEVHRVTGEEPSIFTGREIVARTPPERAPEVARTVGGRHYLFSPVFDEVTPTRVVTRTPAVYFDATKNLNGPKCQAMGPDACGQKPVKTVMWIYEMTWRKTPEGWQIARNVLRDDN